jgi:alkanesulfonate monooxygenase SsuD/methylene tetrahydromethanopterin reductase-like flavin-dependent oxidoreductase (luciferase family)
MPRIDSDFRNDPEAIQRKPFLIFPSAFLIDLPPPIDDIETFWTPFEKEKASAMLNRSFVGSGETVCVGLERFVEETGVDELIVASAIYDHAARLRSYEILSNALDAERN